MARSRGRPRKPKRVDPRIKITLSDDVLKAIDGFRTSHPGATRSAVIQNALERYFDQDSDYQMLFRSFSRMRNALQDLEGKQATLNEAFLLFVRVWFSAQPNLPEQQVRALRKLEPGRFSKYLDQLMRNLDEGAVLTQHLDRPPDIDEEDPERLK